MRLPVCLRIRALPGARTPCRFWTLYNAADSETMEWTRFRSTTVRDEADAARRLRTPDAEATALAVIANGGVVLFIRPMADLGTMAGMRDAAGALHGAWQPGRHEGFARVGEPGAPVWHELHTDDFDAAVTFYENVFGRRTEVLGDSPEFRMSTLGSGPDALAGIYDATTWPAGASRWVNYFGAADTDAAVRLVCELGGTVALDAVDTPFGRMARVADCTGAAFSIMSA